MAYLRDYEGAKHARRVINFAGVVSGAARRCTGRAARFWPRARWERCVRRVPPWATRDIPDRELPERPVRQHRQQHRRVVQPPSVSFMKPAPNVRNVLVQSYCQG